MKRKTVPESENEATRAETVTVTIKAAANCEWQGTLHFADGTEEHFESLPELLLMMGRKFPPSPGHCRD